MGQRLGGEGKGGGGEMGGICILPTIKIKKKIIRASKRKIKFQKNDN